MHYYRAKYENGYEINVEDRLAGGEEGREQRNEKRPADKVNARGRVGLSQEKSSCRSMALHNRFYKVRLFWLSFLLSP
jgi:hypothetical protein